MGWISELRRDRRSCLDGGIGARRCLGTGLALGNCMRATQHSLASNLGAALPPSAPDCGLLLVPRKTVKPASAQSAHADKAAAMLGAGRRRNRAPSDAETIAEIMSALAQVRAMRKQSTIPASHRPASRA